MLPKNYNKKNKKIIKKLIISDLKELLTLVNQEEITNL